jgi:hypothetical protein
MPLKPSSSSTTKTQSVRLAAQSWLASETVIFSGTVRAGDGRSAATVPFWAVGLAGRFWREGTPVVDIVRLRANSDSIFLRMAYTRMMGSTEVRRPSWREGERGRGAERQQSGQSVWRHQQGRAPTGVDDTRRGCAVLTSSLLDCFFLVSDSGLERVDINS